MAKSDVADEPVVVDEPTTAPELSQELSQVEQDALLSVSEGVEGTLTANSPEEKEDGTNTEEPGPDVKQSEGEQTDNVPDDKEPTEPVEEIVEETQPTPELTTEKDEAGVYAPPTAEDPGEFKAGDYSFEIKTTDGKTHKVSSVEDAESLASTLDDNPELISASQFMALNRKTAVMERGLADDKQKYEADKTKFDEQSALTKTRDDTIVQWNNEVNYLANSGDLPKISDEMNSADWTNPEVAKDPAVKARLEIFKWMEGENSKRLSAGLDPIKSVIDAHNAMQLEGFKKNQQQEVSREKETRQKKGAMVGGATSFNPSNAPAGSIVGLGGSLDDVITEYMNQ